MSVNVYPADYGYNLKSELEKLAADTGLYRMTAADVLKSLQQGADFSMTGHHPGDKPFSVVADPANRTLAILDHEGYRISRAELMSSLRHVLPEAAFNGKGADLAKQQGKDKNNEPDQGLNI